MAQWLIKYVPFNQKLRDRIPGTLIWGFEADCFMYLRLQATLQLATEFYKISHKYVKPANVYVYGEFGWLDNL